MTRKFNQVLSWLPTFAVLQQFIVLLVVILIQGCNSENNSDQNFRESVSAYWQTEENEPVVIDLLGENQSIQMNADLHTVKYKNVGVDGKTVNVHAVDFDEIWKLTRSENEQGKAVLHLFIRDGVEGDLSYVMGLFELEKQMKEQATKYQKISLDDLKLDFANLDGVKVKIDTAGDFLAGVLYLQNDYLDANAVDTDVSLLNREERKGIMANCTKQLETCDLTVYGLVNVDDQLLILEKVEFETDQHDNKVKQEPAHPKHAITKPITVKDFKLGMSVAQITDVFTKFGIRPSSTTDGEILLDQCGTNVRVFDNDKRIDSYLYDQSCRFRGYPMLGIELGVNVTVLLHDKKASVFLFEYEPLLQTDNSSVLDALSSKYGAPKKQKNTGSTFFTKQQYSWDEYVWRIDDSQITHSIGQIRLESQDGLRAVKQRIANHERAKLEKNVSEL